MKMIALLTRFFSRTETRRGTARGIGVEGV